MKNIAEFKLRLIAGVIDGLIYIWVYLLVLWRLTSAATLPQLLNQFIVVVFSLVIVLPVVLGTLPLILIAFAGGTVGKLLTGTEIVDSQGNRLSLGRAFLRNYIGYMVSGLFFGLGFWWILKDPERRGWHDQIADSFVVKKHASGIYTGMIALVFLLIGVFYFGAAQYQNILAHRGIYQQIITEINEEFKSDRKDLKQFKVSPTPKPRTPEYEVYRRDGFE